TTAELVDNIPPSHVYASDTTPQSAEQGQIRTFLAATRTPSGASLDRITYQELEWDSRAE
ncbi:unnamed protein product, partial [Parascedosporium putredinis]